MRYLRLALLPLVFAACSERQPAEPDIDIAPSLNAQAPPAESGIVTRGGAPFALTWIDEQVGLRAIVGGDPKEFCAGVVNFDLISWKEVLVAEGVVSRGDPPAAFDRVVSRWVGHDMYTTVWDFLEFDCAKFTSMDPIAFGTSTMRGTDNDVYYTTVHNAEAWGLMAQGTLEWTADGSPAHFSGHQRIHFTNAKGLKLTQTISLH
jgi:hypothetical protein